jgi:hypothetical protein
LRDSTKIAFEKDRYEANLSKLRDLNADLHRLRLQVGDLEQRKPSSSDTNIKEELPAKYAVVQCASQKLYEAISNAWCCPDPTHAAHCASLRLFLEALVKVDAVHLELSIAYESGQKIPQGYVKPPLSLLLQDWAYDNSLKRLEHESFYLRYPSIRLRHLFLKCLCFTVQMITVYDGA